MWQGRNLSDNAKAGVRDRASEITPAKSYL